MRSKAVIVARVLLGLVEGRRRRGVHGWGRCRRVLLPAAFWDVYDHGAALLTGRFVPLALTVVAPVIVNIVTGRHVLSDRRFNTNSSPSCSAPLRYWPGTLHWLR